jgi:hypothetical protein
MRFMKYLLLCLLSLFCGSLFAQNITQQQLVGTWQEKSAIAGGAMLKNFRFSKDGTYALNYSQYDDMNRIVSVNGHYKVKDGIVTLTVDYTLERTGGKVQKSDSAEDTGEFVLKGGEVKKIPQDGAAYDFSVIVDKQDKSGNATLFTLSETKYYKVVSK